ncbi:uncharacterized protein O3Q21_013302 [Podargus strigoides]
MPYFITGSLSFQELEKQVLAKCSSAPSDAVTESSAILSKIQDVLLGYEQIIECEKNRYRAVCREVRRLESEKQESQSIAEETQQLKSLLAQQEAEWKSNIQSLKFTLKEEEEKRLRAETLYEKTREDLRRKEDQYCKEREEKQQLELHSRNSEMELTTLRKLLKQVEEERDETQRQLSEEKSARALQEGILNCHLWRQKELEEETRTVRKNSEGTVRQLQQELADALKKQSMSEASLEVTTRYRSDLEEDKLRLQKELEKTKTKLWELEEQHLQSEHCVQDLKTALDNKEREVRALSQKLQDLLLASSGTNTTIKQLEEHVQCLEIENARLEATVQQQSNWIEALQRDLQASASVHNRMEDLITSLQTTQAAAEDHHHQQMQNQNVLAVTSKDLHSMWEEQLKSRSHLEERGAQLDREKAELLEQRESERKKVKKLVELKRTVELRLEQAMKRNIELQEDCKRLKKLLNRAVKKLRMYEDRETESHLNLQGEMKNRYSEVGRLQTKIGEISQQLELESKKCMQLEVQNQDLREELSTMRGNHEKLEKSKCQLKEEVANLRHHLETNMVHDSSRVLS